MIHFVWVLWLHKRIAAPPSQPFAHFYLNVFAFPVDPFLQIKISNIIHCLWIYTFNPSGEWCAKNDFGSPCDQGGSSGGGGRDSTSTQLLHTHNNGPPNINVLNWLRKSRWDWCSCSTCPSPPPPAPPPSCIMTTPCPFTAVVLLVIRTQRQKWWTWHTELVRLILGSNELIYTWLRSVPFLYYVVVY